MANPTKIRTWLRRARENMAGERHKVRRNVWQSFIADRIVMEDETNKQPRLLVFSSLFPSKAQPNAGVFIRERMLHVAKEVPVVVVAPVPWFPLQGLMRWFVPHYRPPAVYFENQYGMNVYRPKFFAIPGLFRYLDGFFMAVGSYLIVKRMKREFGANIIDAHFAFPEGYAGALLGKWLRIPLTVTLRGTEVRMCRDKKLRPRVLFALNRATRVITVANFLKDIVIAAGADAEKITRVGNGVDCEKFQPTEKSEARARYGLHLNDKVLVSVGGLVPRKGFHRVIELMPELIKRHSDLKFLIVGGASGEGDFRAHLERIVQDLKLADRVLFLGPVLPEEIKYPISASDVFVLATANEGWANVFLEAMACGIPVVTTRVGGNAEVITSDEHGTLVGFGEPRQLLNALDEALSRSWNSESIRRYALNNTWDSRVDDLCTVFRETLSSPKD